MDVWEQLVFETNVLCIMHICLYALAQQRTLDIFPCSLGVINAGHRSLWELLWIN